MKNEELLEEAQQALSEKYPRPKFRIAVTQTAVVLSSPLLRLGREAAGILTENGIQAKPLENTMQKPPHKWILSKLSQKQIDAEKKLKEEAAANFKKEEEEKAAQLAEQKKVEEAERQAAEELQREKDEEAEKIAQEEEALKQQQETEEAEEEDKALEKLRAEYKELANDEADGRWGIATLTEQISKLKK